MRRKAGRGSLLSATWFQRWTASTASGDADRGILGRLLRLRRHSDSPVDESAAVGLDWWGTDSATIEQAALAARQHGVRTVLLRTGCALTPASLASEVAQFRRRLGGWIGTEQGWTPCIDIADEVGIITFALQRPDLDGPANLTAPGAVRARHFARALGNVLGHAAWLPVPTPFVRMGLGAATDIIVGGKRIEPAKITAAGYQFRFPDVEPALRHIIDQEPAT